MKNLNKEKRIEVINVFKKFNPDFRKNESALFNIIKIISGKKIKNEIEVLSGVSFDVHKGEVLGIIGKNGSGKSTLLRLIAGVYEVDSGEIKIKGSVVYLTGFGHGSSPKLTMKENIYLIGSVMGLSQKNIKRRFNDIVEFSGLKDFVDMRVYQFSTGMLSRLNFSIIIHCLNHQRPEILLFDEVFSSGGDFEFQKKATAKMEELINSGATVVMVSHDFDVIEKYCDRVLFLDCGNIVDVGDSKTVISKYLDMNSKK
jgi:ABC-type polysaccharide/polyol phosphate transport system ATPase subunit